MKGILFTAPMVRAILAGRKTVTRRIIPEKILEKYYAYDDWCNSIMPQDIPCTRDYEKQFFADRSPYRPGEVVYVKETWAQIWNQDGCIQDGNFDECQCPCEGCHVEYKADTGAKYPADWPDDSTGDPSCPTWKSPLFMPEWASRLHFEIVSVRPERVQEITEEDAVREGMIPDPVVYGGCCHVDTFIRTWESLHPGSWERNDWVWRVEFRRTP